MMNNNCGLVLVWVNIDRYGFIDGNNIIFEILYGWDNLKLKTKSVF